MTPRQGAGPELVEGPDVTAVRTALGEARRERARIRREIVPVPDSAHLIFRGAESGTLIHVAVQMPASPYEGAPGRPRYRDLASLRAFLDEVARDAPALRARLAPESGAASALLAVLFCHAMAGTGAELQVVGRVHSTAEIPWEIVRAPSDGGPISLGTDVSEGALRQAFGRELTLASAWQRALTRARSGETVIEEVETGHWLYAAPGGRTPGGNNSEDGDALEARVGEVLARPGRWQRVDLRKPGARAVSFEPDFAQWLPEFGADIRSGALRAGALIDAASAEAHLLGVIEHRGLRMVRRPGESAAMVTDGDVGWPVDVELLAIATVVLGHYLDESAAAFVGVVRASLQRLRDIVAAVRAVRPDHKFELDGTTAWPAGADGTPGRPLALPPLVARWGPGTLEFDREIRFACDPIPKGSDPSRVCPCGAPARLALRLVPGARFDAVQRRYSKQPLSERAQWSRGAVRHVAAVVAVCDAHERYVTRAELSAAGLDGAALDARLGDDRVYESFEITATVRSSPGGHRAVFVRGENVAAVALSDELLAGLHGAVGAPLAGRVGKTAVEAVPADGLVLYDTDADAGWLSAQMAAFAGAGAAAAGEVVTLGWPVDLRVRGVGRYVPARGMTRGEAAKPAIRPGAAAVSVRRGG